MQHVEIELDGKTRQLIFDFNAASELERHLGKGITAVLTQDQIGFNLTQTLYWVGLKRRDRGLTFERTGQILQKEIENGASLETLIVPVIEAFVNSGLIKITDEADDEGESPN